MQNFSTIPTILAILFSATGFAQTPPAGPGQSAESVVQDFLKVSKCTERIWPNYSWAGKMVVVVDAKQSLQNVIDIDALEARTLPITEIPHNSEGLNSTFDFFEAQGKTWMSINSNFGEWDKAPHAVFGLGVHEAFHRLIQTEQLGWVWRFGVRGQEIPIRPEPRYARAMIEQNLLQALKYPAQQSQFLQKARFWYDLWQTGSPNENTSTTDGYEGTARYSDMIGKALAELGCDSTEAALKEQILKAIAKSYSILSFAGTMATDTEGYSIGSLAGFVLRFQSSIPGWENRVIHGETPLDVLLKDVAAQKEEVVSKDFQNFKTNTQAAQLKVDFRLKSTRELLSTKNYVTVGFPSTWKPGSTGYEGFYNDLAQGYRFSVQSTALDFNFGDSQVRSDLQNVMVQTQEQSLCPGAVYYFVVRDSELTRLNDKFILNAEKLKGTLSGSLRLSGTGTKFLCAGEK